MTETSTPMQVCLLTPGETVPLWAGRALERMLAETEAELSLIVEDTSSDERSRLDTVRRLVELREWGIIAAGMQVFADDLEPLERYPVSELDGASDADFIACEPQPVDGWKKSIPEVGVELMAETDVAIRFGFGFLVGDALTAPDQGVLSFHHGDLREYRGQPMGFWEYVQGRETGGVTLQRINETLDGGEIITSRRVDIRDAPTWGAVRCRLFDVSEEMLVEGIRRLQSEDFEPETLSEDELGDLYTLPKGRPVAKYLQKTARGVLVG